MANGRPSPWMRWTFLRVGAILERTALQYTSRTELERSITNGLLERDWVDVGDLNLAIIKPRGHHGLIPESTDTQLQAAVAWHVMEQLSTVITPLLWLDHHHAVALQRDGTTVVHALRLGSKSANHLLEFRFAVFHTPEATFPDGPSPCQLVIHTDTPQTHDLPGVVFRPCNVTSLLRKGGITHD